MGICEDCGTEIADKYKVCIQCLKKRQQANKAENEKDTIKALSYINNNLYYIRRALAVILREKFKTEIVWREKTKDTPGDFEEKKAK